MERDVLAAGAREGASVPDGHHVRRGMLRTFAHASIHVPYPLSVTRNILPATPAAVWIMRSQVPALLLPLLTTRSLYPGARVGTELVLF